MNASIHLQKKKYNFSNQEKGFRRNETCYIFWTLYRLVQQLVRFRLERGNGLLNKHDLLKSSICGIYLNKTSNRFRKSESGFNSIFT